MKRFFLAVLVGLGILFPVTFVPAQGNGTPEVVPEFDSMPQQMDTILVEIIADADSVIAVPTSVTVSRVQGGRNLRADPQVVIGPEENR